MSVDEDVLAMLRAVEHLNVHDGYVDVDEASKVIAVELPYVVYSSTPGRDREERYSGHAVGRVTDFRITGVGETREQAKAVLDRARAAISRKRIGQALIKRDNENQPVRREDTYTRPGGLPLFYGIDGYSVGS